MQTTHETTTARGKGAVAAAIEAASDRTRRQATKQAMTALLALEETLAAPGVGAFDCLTATRATVEMAWHALQGRSDATGHVLLSMEANASAYLASELRLRVAKAIGWDPDAITPGPVFVKVAIAAGQGNARLWAVLEATALAVRAALTALDREAPVAQLVCAAAEADQATALAVAARE